VTCHRRVRLVARGVTGWLSLRWWSPAKEGYEERTLGHSDRDLGEQEAKQVSAALLSARPVGAHSISGSSPLASPPAHVSSAGA
jgi:hypothetical protein